MPRGNAPSRKDANHGAIKAVFLRLGCTVIDTHAIAGALDMLVGVAGVSCLVEVKDGSKSASKRKLTPAEQETIDSWRGFPCSIVINEGEAELLVRNLRRHGGEQ